MSKCGYNVDSLSILPRKTCSRLFTHVAEVSSNTLNAVYRALSFHEFSGCAAQVIHVSKLAWLYLLYPVFSPVSTVPTITKIKN